MCVGAHARARACMCAEEMSGADRSGEERTRRGEERKGEKRRGGERRGLHRRREERRGAEEKTGREEQREAERGGETQCQRDTMLVQDLQERFKGDMSAMSRKYGFDPFFMRWRQERETGSFPELIRRRAEKRREYSAARLQEIAYEMHRPLTSSRCFFCTCIS